MTRIVQTREEAVKITTLRLERTWTRYATCLLLCAGLVGPARGAGRIAGLVRAEDGPPIPGAVVTYTRIPRFAKGSRPGSLVLAAGEVELSSKVGSTADGTFEIASVPAGQYLLCAEAPAGAYLNPCKWTGG